MEDVELDDERERHWRVVLEDNDGGLDENKYIIHSKSCNVYMNGKEFLLKCGYYVESVVYY